MAQWVIRDMTNADLDAGIRVWDLSGVNNQEPIFSIAQVVASVDAGVPAVVAVVDDEVVGTACSLVDGDRAWICRLALRPDWRNLGIGSELLMALEQRLVAAGVTRLSALLHEGEIGDQAFANSNYAGPKTLRYYDRRESIAASDVQTVHDLGGRLIAPTEWARLSGGEATKKLLERTMVLPLANPTVAERAGLRPPGAAILFGPPGTGKTSLARGVAGRLGWPFIEVFPAQLGSTPTEIAAGVRDTFDQLREVEHAVVFIDEVDEVASHRQEASAGQAITNELLKVIPQFRNRSGKLLICATNNVSRLDSAFLRTGRFDFIIPIGPPDLASRKATLEAEISRVTEDEMDIASLAERTEGYTVADLDHLVRSAAQAAFERSLASGGASSFTQEDLEAALAVTKASVSREDAEVFAHEIEEFSRI